MNIEKDAAGGAGASVYMDNCLSTASTATQVGMGADDPRRWLALAVIAAATLMVVLDASIVNIALPHAQTDLHISDADRQWVLTAYTLAFGGLLLLGGRIADFAGRRRVFLIGLIGFAAASAIGGAAQNATMLFGARALQGAFAALLAPAALSLIAVTFLEPHERAKAFGVYGAVAGGGGALGLILGGVLTEYASWRWCLFVNVPIAVAAALAALPTVRESRADGDRSAMLNTTQQTGGALGVALLNTLYASAVTSYLTSHPPGPGGAPQLRLDSFLHGYRTAFTASGCLFAAALLVTIFVINAHKDAGPGSHGAATASLEGAI